MCADGAKRALITGITGQDGSWLAELLLAEGCEVHGLVRPGTEIGRTRLADVANHPLLRVHEGLIEDVSGMTAVLLAAEPDELYHLAGQTRIVESVQAPERTFDVVARATVSLMESVRRVSPRTRVMYAGSSEVFGRPEAHPQNELTPFRPVTPYGVAKAASTRWVAMCRDRYGLHAGTAILFNHESERRGADFVTMKVCAAAAAIRAGLQEGLTLGSLDVRRDWGDARDYVRGMRLMLRHEQPDDYVFATGETHSVRELVEVAFDEAGLDWSKHVRHEPAFDRPGEAREMRGDPARAESVLGWRRETGFDALIRRMTRSELRRHGID
jgi:GDPmannose 4,6-dehydratase